MLGNGLELECGKRVRLVRFTRRSDRARVVLLRMLVPCMSRDCWRGEIANSCVLGMVCVGASRGTAFELRGEMSSIVKRKVRRSE